MLKKENISETEKIKQVSIDEPILLIYIIKRQRSFDRKQELRRYEEMEKINKRVLVCDDSKFMRLHIRRILEKVGYHEIYEAENGSVALEKYEEVSPDMVFMDIVMPEKDGVSAVREIMEYDHNAKIVMCSAMGQKPFIVDAIKAGAKEFIVKPFEAKKITMATSHFLG